METNNKQKIYTLTLNPSMDYIIKTDLPKSEMVYFTPEENVLVPGGKGINASIILNELGVENTAIHYSGGFTGDLIIEGLNKDSIDNIQVRSEDRSRLNLKINYSDETVELNSTAIPLTENAKEEIKKIISTFNKGEILMIMGSFHDQDISFIKEISRQAYDIGVELVYDLSKPILMELVGFNPIIVKPNIEELEMIFQMEIAEKDDIINCMDILKNMGAKNVAVTNGAQTSYLVDSSGSLHIAEMKQVKLVSPQGCGDSFVSTFVHKIKDGAVEAFEWANAAGCATAQVKGLANKQQIEDNLSNVRVTSVK